MTLTTKERPAIVARIKAARELGDLRENADYEAARREQSFLEGRVAQIEEMIRSVVVIDDIARSHVVGIGSVVTVEHDGAREIVHGRGARGGEARRAADQRHVARSGGR